MTSIIQTKHQGQARVQITFSANGEQAHTDAPKPFGGLGEHPSPVQLMAASLAACALTTLGMAAQKGGVSIDGATAEVENIEYNDTHDAVTRITIRFHLSDAVPADMRKRLEAYAHRGCAVGNSLSAEKNFIFEYA